MNILITRFSSLGDVALILPVIRAFHHQFPEHSITLISNKIFRDLFVLEPNLTFVGADLKKQHKGVQGLHSLYKSIKNQHRIDCVMDLHDSLRSNFLNVLFKTAGIKVYKLDKGRAKKKELTRKGNKHMAELKHTTQRYADVFGKAGFDVKLDHRLRAFSYPPTQTVKLPNKKRKWIGVAPFAKHKGKQLPLDMMKAVLTKLNTLDVKIFIFGSGHNEQALTNQLISDLNNASSFINTFTMQDELHLMQEMDVMLTMDSANMHLASAVGTPVVSVWGATHPFAGFLGYGQSQEHIVQDSIECRPCSVYGNKECWRGDYACLYNIDIQQIVVKVKSLLN